MNDLLHLLLLLLFFVHLLRLSTTTTTPFLIRSIFFYKFGNNRTFFKPTPRIFVCLFFSTASSVAPRCWIQDSKFYIQEAFTSVPPSHHSFPYIRDQFCHDNCLLIDVCLHCSSCLRFRIFSIHFYQQQQQSHTKGAWEMEREKRFSKFNRTINHHHFQLINSLNLNSRIKSQRRAKYTLVLHRS